MSEQTDQRDLDYHNRCRDAATRIGRTLRGSTPDAGFSTNQGEDVPHVCLEYIENAEALRAQLAAVSMVMCGKPEFPGDLAQYVRNEIEGRTRAEAQLAAVTQERDRLRDANDRILGIIARKEDAGTRLDAVYHEAVHAALGAQP